MTSIAIVGAGAVGGFVGVQLIEAGFDVTLCVRTPFELLRVGAADFMLERRPKLARDAAAMKPVDWVIFAPKAYDTEAAAPWLRRLVGDHTGVAVMQNGVEHVERLSQHVQRPQIVPCIVDFAVAKIGTGEIVLKRAGEVVCSPGAAGAAFAALLQEAGLAARVSDDFLTEAWRKLCYNAAGAVQALTGLPNGVAREQFGALIMHALAAECAEVALAEGARVSKDIADEVVAAARRGSPGSVNSLLADLRAGRPLESDARNGVIVRKGAAHGIATPANAMAMWILGALQPAAAEAASAGCADENA